MRRRAAAAIAATGLLLGAACGDDSGAGPGAVDIFGGLRAQDAEYICRGLKNEIWKRK